MFPFNIKQYGPGPVQDYEGAMEVLSQKRKRSPDPERRAIARATERDNTLTRTLYNMNIIPKEIQTELKSHLISLPLGLMRPGHKMPKIYPPGVENAQPIEITERESAWLGIMRQKEVAVGTGIDPAKGYFVVVFDAFDEPIMKMTEEHRRELPDIIRKQLEQWEISVLQGCQKGDVVAKFVERNFLKKLGFTMDGAHR